jgi:hypothetical protein
VSTDDDGPGWEMQDDNERRRWDEEQAALNRCRRLTGELRDETGNFERDMQQLNESIRSQSCRK